MATAAAASIRQILEAFLVAAHRAAQESDHAEPVLVTDIAKELGISEPLAEKVAVFLETEGLLDYDDQSVDITVAGMLHVEGDRKKLRPSSPDGAGGAGPKSEAPDADE